jgi:hypothetical protein
MSIVLDSSVSVTPLLKLKVNEGKSAASFCRQVAAWLPDMFCNFYFVKNYKIAKNSATTKAREKLINDSESLDFLDV